MTTLFYPPKFDSGLPGAKLTFSATGTSTLQNTYQDEALSTPHANPVVADADGLFSPIYLDPRLPSYRVLYTTSANVTIYQIDGYPSNQGVQQTMRLEATAPSLIWYDTDGTVNQRKFRMFAGSGGWVLQGSNDAESVFTDFISIKGGVTQRVAITSAAVIDDGVTEYAIAYDISNSFTGTLTGYATPPTAMIYYTKINSHITIRIPGAADGFTGTSNATSMTITGIPAILIPTTTQYVLFTGVVDNGNLIGDGEQVLVRIGSDGVLTFMINGSTTGFTGSGTKSTSLGGTFSYLKS